jgi:hypothetical protein
MGADPNGGAVPFTAERLGRGRFAGYFPPDKRVGLGGDLEAAGGVAGADCEGDGFEQACGDEAGGLAVEVEDRGGGLGATDAVLIA